MSITSLYRRVLALYRAEARLLLALALVVFVPVGLVDSISIEFDPNSVGVVVGAALLVAFMLDISVGLVGVVFYSGVVSGVVEARERGEPVSVASVLRRLPYRRLVAIDVLLILGTVFGLVLLVVPGIVFLAWFCLAPPLAELEGLGVRAAMRRSRELVRPHFWTVFGVVWPLWLLTGLVDSGLSVVAHALGSGFVAEWLTLTVALTVTSPLYAVAVALLAVELPRDEPADA